MKLNQQLFIVAAITTLFAGVLQDFSTLVNIPTTLYIISGSILFYAILISDFTEN